MRVGKKAARAVVGPFDRSREFTGRVQNAVIFGIGRLFHPERSADTIGQDAHLVAPDSKYAGDVIAKPEHTLVRDVEVPMLALGIILRDCGARLHRIDDDAIVAEPEASDMGSARKSGGNLLAVTVMKIEADIPRHVVVKLRCTRSGRLARAGDGRQWVDVDEYRLGG